MLSIRDTEQFWRERCSSLSDDDGALELARSLREISAEIGTAIARYGPNAYSGPGESVLLMGVPSLAVYAGTLKAAADALERVPVDAGPIAS
jgi:hypothetical protein